MTPKGAYFLFKNLQYQMVAERFEKRNLAGDKEAEVGYKKSIAELDYVYGPPADFIDTEEIERSIMNAKVR